MTAQYSMRFSTIREFYLSIASSFVTFMAKYADAPGKSQHLLIVFGL
jgi:hypothetical protein